MNDRYLYRAKRIDNGEWVEGYYCRAFRWTGDKDPVPAIQEKDTFYFRQVDPSTICQCTGLKDKKGKLIWENDILSIAKRTDTIGGYYFPPLQYPKNVFVKWDFCAWMWEVIDKNKFYINFLDAWCHYESEVIGNIFDNPELLEVGE